MDAILLTIPDDRIIDANPAAEKLLGYPKSEIIKIGINDLVGVKEIRTHDLLTDRKKMGISSGRLNFKKKDGTILTTEVNSSKFKDRNENEKNTLVIKDITEILKGEEERKKGRERRKKGELALKKSEHRFRVITDSAVDGIVTIDANGFIKYYNDSFGDIFGYDKRELIGKNLTVIMPDRSKNAHNKGLKSFNESGEHIHVGNTFEATGLKKDGKIFPIEMSLAIWEFDSENFFTGIIRDLTRSKRLEKDLRESEKKYRELVDNSLVAVYETSLDGELLFANDAMIKMFDYDSVEDLKSQNMINILKTPADAEKFIENLRNYGNITQQEMDGITKSGKTITGLVNVNLIGDKISGMVMDITDRKKAEEALRESEEYNRSIVDSSPDCIKVLDLEGNLLLMSEGGQKIMDVDDVTSILNTNLINFYSEKFQPAARAAISSASHGEYARFTGFCPTLKGTPKWWDVIVTPILDSKGKPEKLSAVSRDITNSIKAEEQIQDQLKKLTILNQVIDMAFNATNIDDLLRDIVHSTMELLGFNSSGIYLLEENKRYVELVNHENFPPAILENHSREKVDELPFSKLYGDKKPLYYNIESYPSIKRTGFKSLAMVPLYSTSNIIGSLSVASSEKTSVSDLELDILESIGLEAGTVIAKMYSDKVTKDSLKEKEVLLKEIHHRVKNNLQIISSLLDLQESYVKEYPTAVNVLEESKNRVMSMAMIHEMLYQSKDLSQINLSDYINMMVSNLTNSYGAKTLPVIDVEEIYLNIETSVPLGLIISELVSNSLKYAFPQDKNGEISVNLHHKDENYQLTISDNGIGLPANIDFQTESTLGLRLVHSLVNQIDGIIHLDRTKGTKYTITFTELKYRKRL